MAVAAIILRECFAEISDQPARDAAAGAREVENLREALRVAGFALREKSYLTRGDGGGVALRSVAAEAEAVAEARGFLRDGSGFLQPCERLHNAVARFAEALRGGFDFKREVLWPAPSAAEKRIEEAAAFLIERGENRALALQKLHLRALVKCTGGAQQAVEFQISDDGLDDEWADVRLLREIVAAHVELLARAEHSSHKRLDGVRLGGVTEREIFQWDRVVRAREQFAVRRLAVATCAPDFLLIVFERLWQVEMDYAADVRLINAHAECDGRDDHLALAAHECLLRGITIFGSHAGVISSRPEPRASEMRGHVLGGFLESHIHDGGADLRVSQTLREHGQALARRARRHAQMEISTAEGSLHMPLRRDAKCLANVARHIRRRRRREREHGAQRQLLGHAREAQVLGAEIVAPLGNAVRLVNCEERDFHAPQPLQKYLTREPLGRDVEQLQLPRAQVGIQALRLLGGEAGVEPRRCYAACTQRVDLVFHQRDERRNDESRAFEQHCRELVAKRLPRARWKKCECGFAVEQRVDHILLSIAKGIVAEVRAEGRHEIHAGAGSRTGTCEQDCGQISRTNTRGVRRRAFSARRAPPHTLQNALCVISQKTPPAIRSATPPGSDSPENLVSFQRLVELVSAVHEVVIDVQSRRRKGLNAQLPKRAGCSRQRAPLALFCFPIRRDRQSPGCSCQGDEERGSNRAETRKGVRLFAGRGIPFFDVASDLLHAQNVGCRSASSDLPAVEAYVQLGFAAPRNSRSGRTPSRTWTNPIKCE